LIFITGATGFLGSNILKKLVDQNETVVAIKRKESSLHMLGNYKDKVKWIEGDVNDISTLESAMSGCRLVYHCAATISLSNKDRTSMYKANVEGTANIVNLSLYHKVQKLVHISSVSALPALEDRLIDESSIWYNKPYPSTYGLTKFLAEREAQRGIAEGLNTIILCPSSIIGACNWNSGSGLFFTNMHRGIPFYTEGSGGFVDVEDVANIAIRCMNNQEINNDKFIVSGSNLSYKDFFGMIAKSMGKRPPSLELNFLLGQIAIYQDAIKCALLGTERIVTQEALEMAKIKTRYNNSKVKELLAYQFIPIEQTVAATSAVFLNETKRRNR